MNTDLLHEKRVLRLNANWQAYDTCSVQEAFKAMFRIRQKHYTATMKRPWNALHIEYPIEDGVVKFDCPITYLPVEWKDWQELPVRFYDSYLNTQKKLIRVPTIIIAQNYIKIPDFTSGFSKGKVWERDKSTCQLTNEKVTKRTGNIEHRIPLKDGGKTSYENCYIVKKELNKKKGHLSPEEFYKKNGFKDPLPKLKPPQKGKIEIRNIYNVPDWYLFPNVVRP